MGIWRNIGKIVSLSCEIILLEMKWYIRSFKTSPTKKSNPPSRIERYNEEQESLERSKLMVELCEKPYYNIKPE